jgi:hypothetical protein
MLKARATTNAAARREHLLCAGARVRFESIHMPQLGSTQPQSLCVEPNKWGYDRG